MTDENIVLDKTTFTKKTRASRVSENNARRASTYSFNLRVSDMAWAADSGTNSAPSVCSNVENILLNACGEAHVLLLHGARLLLSRRWERTRHRAHH